MTKQLLKYTIFFSLDLNDSIKSCTKLDLKLLKQLYFMQSFT